MIYRTSIYSKISFKKSIHAYSYLIYSHNSFFFSRITILYFNTLIPYNIYIFNGKKKRNSIAKRKKDFVDHERYNKSSSKNLFSQLRGREKGDRKINSHTWLNTKLDSTQNSEQELKRIILLSIESLSQGIISRQISRGSRIEKKDIGSWLKKVETGWRVPPQDSNVAETTLIWRLVEEAGGGLGNRLESESVSPTVS